MNIEEENYILKGSDFLDEQVRLQGTSKPILVIISPSYYTPKLKEFVDGFEYEIKDGFGDGTVKTLEDWKNSEWVKRTFYEAERPYIRRTLEGKNSTTLPPAIRAIQKEMSIDEKNELIAAFMECSRKVVPYQE